jgi:Rrf2 family protein
MMRVSQKADYALRAMLELALRHNQSAPARTADIARQQQIPEKFLELILVELRRAGLIVSQRGPVGGHRLSRSPSEISVGEIWRVIDGGGTESTAGGKKDFDPFKAVWEDVDKAISRVVDGVSLSEIRKVAETGRGVPDYSI